MGDFNGDGKLDLAVTQYLGGVTILLGNGDSTFTATSPATGPGAFVLAVADLNGDGKLDLAVPDASTANVAILLGNGDGTFTPNASSPSAGYAAYAIAVGDFNGDGRLDLATANNQSNNISVLLPLAPIPAASISPGSLTFSNQNLGTTSVSQPVTLSNTGTTALAVTTIATSSNFGETDNCDGSVAADTSCTIGVTFSPTAGGPLTGTLTITDNSTGLPDSTQTVSLSGTGAAGPPISIGPTWSETGGNEDMAVAVAAFVASGTPTLVGHAEAGNPSSATTAAINTSGATLLVAWLAVEGADPAAPSDNYHNTWQPLPVYANGTHSHGRFFYAYNPTVGPGHTFTAAGLYIALEVSAWSGMLSTSGVYQGSTGAVNASTKSLATATLSFTAPVLLVTAWGADSQYYQGLAVSQGFNVMGSLTNFTVEEIASHAFLVSGAPGTLVSLAVTPSNASLTAGATQQFTATGTYGDGSTQNLTSTVTWSSTNTAAATITGGGLATAVAAGSTAIQATSGGISGSTSLTVTGSGGGGGSSISPTWSETGGNEDMAVAVAAFVASGTPTLVGHAEAGNPSSATTSAINTSGATLLVAWLAVEGADPTAPTDSYHNAWQPLPVYANGSHSHGRFFYAYNPVVGPGHTFTAGGAYIAIEVSAWSGTLSTSGVYQGSTGSVNASTKSLATGTLSFTGPVLLVTAWAADSQFYQGLAVNQGFTVLGSLTNYSLEEIASHAYVVSR